MTLTAKQQRFVSEYLIDFNGTQAAIRSGYASSGARTEGARLLANAGIQAELRAAQAAYAAQHGVTIAEVTEMHREAYNVALEDRQPSAMTAAANNLAKLHGLIVDKQQVQQLRLEDWLDEIRAGQTVDGER
ncbi:MAG: hypothetical protein BWK73_35915 [Thiothrix lacustris]|uniref:Terminase small subunit n=1 Tax=Thiothrix lacustris TaxID=525917 RepID=A0A1Y1QG94_9GAMM|nr:MAG: hypothetical protein BWK73_35915 [Thiothrix lacustris]